MRLLNSDMDWQDDRVFFVLLKFNPVEINFCILWFTQIVIDLNENGALQNNVHVCMIEKEKPLDNVQFDMDKMNVWVIYLWNANKNWMNKKEIMTTLGPIQGIVQVINSCI